MALTKEEIDLALAAAPPAGSFRFKESDLALFKQEEAYRVAVDYLTGVAPLPAEFYTTYRAAMLARLFYTIQSLEQPSANDVLVLHLLWHGSVTIKIKYDLYRMLIGYAMEHGAAGVWPAVVQQLTRFASSYTALNCWLWHGSVRDIPDQTVFRNSALYKEIETEIRSLPPVLEETVLRDRWDALCFSLADEINPGLANEYLLKTGLEKALLADVNDLLPVRKGAYIPGVISWISSNPEKNASPFLEKRMQLIVALYGMQPERFKELLQEASLDYLANVRGAEPYVRPVAFEDALFPAVAMSTFALFFLRQVHPEDADKMLQTVFRSGNKVPESTIEMLCRQLPEAEAQVYLEMAVKQGVTYSAKEYYTDLFRIQERYGSLEQRIAFYWKMAAQKNKTLRMLLAEVILQHDAAAEQHAITALGSKNGETRQMAVQLLSRLATATAQAAMLRALDVETNEPARDLLLQTMESSLPVPDAAFVDQMMAAAVKRGKLDKPAETWLSEEVLPAVYYHDGREVPPVAIRFLFYRMSRIKGMRSEWEARAVLSLIDKERTAPFALAMIKLFIEHDTRPEHKFLMALAAMLGDEKVADKIRIATEKWIEDGRMKMAEYGVGALALQGSNKALRTVEWFSRKYKNKKAAVGAAALKALEDAAEELNISVHELGDRIVPDFGFEGLFRHFEVNGESFRAFVDSNFKLAYFNEDNKKLKALPAAAGAELKNEFKYIAKEVRDITRSQSSRLEYYLIVQRRWSYKQWQLFFLQNPVMFIYATKLLWGAYDGNGALVHTFICTEDTSLLDINGEETELPEGVLIGMVHPVQLTAALLDSWKQQFFTQAIDPVFPQLNRQLGDITAIDLTKGIIHQFEGKHMKTGAIRTTLEKRGWHKGPTGDGGWLGSMQLSYNTKHIVAVLELDGVGVGYGFTDEEKTGRLYVLNSTKANGPVYASLNTENDPRLVPLNQLPEIFLREMLAAVEAITPA